MKKFTILLCAAAFVFGFAVSANAGLMGYYYNHSSEHPDMQRWITNLDTGYVENDLTGATPTLTAYGETRVKQWDWWNPVYYNFARVDSDTDLSNGFSTDFFPTSDGLPGDPYHFAVHWTGTFYVAADQTYNYQMASDDDSWLFIDNVLTLDLGGVHAMSNTNDDVFLTAGWHDIDIFFAERHTVASGFKLNFFSDLEPSSVPEPATMVLLGFGLVGLAGLGRGRFKKG